MIIFFFCIPDTALHFGNTHKSRGSRTRPRTCSRTSSCSPATAPIRSLLAFRFSPRSSSTTWPSACCPVAQSFEQCRLADPQISKFSSRVFYSLQELFLRKFVHFSPKFKTLILTKIYSEPMFITSSVSSSSNRKSTRFLPSSSENDFSVKWRASIAEIPTRFIPI